MKPGSLFAKRAAKKVLALLDNLYLMTKLLTLFSRGPKQCIRVVTHFSTTR